MRPDKDGINVIGRMVNLQRGNRSVANKTGDQTWYESIIFHFAEG